MTNDLTKVGYSMQSLIPASSREVEDIMGWCLSASEVEPGGKLVLRNFPEGETRAALRARAQVLLSALKSHDKTIKAALISQMIGCYAPKDGEDKKAVVVKFVEELSDIPTWAVWLACERIRMGTAPDISHVYRPSTIQVRVEAMRHVAPFRSQVRRITALLSAEKYIEPASEEMRERVGGLLRGLVDELRATAEVPDQTAVTAENNRRMMAASRHAIDREYAALGIEPIGNISPSLARLLGHKIPERKGKRRAA